MAESARFYAQTAGLESKESSPVKRPPSASYAAESPPE